MLHMLGEFIEIGFLTLVGLGIAAIVYCAFAESYERRS